jgi:hypothetical protein
MRDERFEMRISAELLARVDEWRQRQTVPPTRAAAVRWMIERCLGDYDCPAPPPDPTTGTPLDNEPAFWLRGKWTYTQASALRAIAAAAPAYWPNGVPKLSR